MPLNDFAVSTKSCVGTVSDGKRDANPQQATVTGSECSPNERHGEATRVATRAGNARVQESSPFRAGRFRYRV